MSTYSGTVCPNVFLPGAGLEKNGDPSPGMLLRIETTLDYLEAFESRIGIVVCSGAFSASAEEPDNGAREARVAADAIVKRFPHAQFKVEAEDKSQTTFQNVRYVLQEGFFDDEIDRDHPLGIVTVPAQYRRIRPIASRGFDTNAIHNIKVQEKLDPVYRLKALGAVGLTHLAIRGILPGSAEGLIVAEERFTRNAARLGAAA